MLEVIVSRTNFISSHTEKPVRVVGLSTALANARDLADWLNINQVCKRHERQLFLRGGALWHWFGDKNNLRHEQ